MNNGTSPIAGTLWEIKKLDNVAQFND